MRNIIFEGVATAIITPFKYDSFIDYKVLEQLIETQVTNDIKALVVAGTTGESAALTDDEQYELIKFVVNTVAGRIPVIAGAGSNNTEHAKRLCRNAKRAGANGLLIVTPYYNKANEEGLYMHYKTCSEGAENELPIIVYDVPSRTGMSIKEEYYEKLLDIENIVGVKEASGDVVKMARIIARYGREISVYSGNDELILPALSLGGKGVISVVSNIVPYEMQCICNEYFRGNLECSRSIFLHYMELISSMFIDINPICVKEALAIMGSGTGKFRLPLTPLSERDRNRLINILKKYHLL